MTELSNPLASPEAFLATGETFRLGFLPTEQSHPDSQNLDRLARQDPQAALDCLQGVDAKAWRAIDEGLNGLETLAADLKTVLNTGGRIFVAGCGATGRLALTLESWSQVGWLPGLRPGQIVAFMAGGDAALVRSLEGFEDHPEFGRRQLNDLGFNSEDLLIGVTEGGETPFVIGATEAASEQSRHAAWFLFCNPIEPLLRIERSRRVIESDRIRSLPLVTGPQAVAGSTRMQASSVLLAGLWLAVTAMASPGSLRAHWSSLKQRLQSHSYRDIADFPIVESEQYQNGNYVLYTAEESALSVLTDTTERAPTFSLVPFENLLESADALSLCYLSMPSAPTAALAWQRLLGRSPRTVEWPQLSARSGLQRLLGFDISRQAAQRRQQAAAPAASDPFRVATSPAGIQWQFKDQSLELATPGWSQPEQQLLLKLLLNAHSTCLMGRLGRYEGNCMTWVQASNGKLIDRAARTVQMLYQRQRSRGLDYEQAVRAVFAVRSQLKPGQPVVMPALQLVLKANL
ncbi:MAG: SIS domain-containing protein [Opitutales bacterium]|nr:SIS domain-containing protein [Opitutales bacterium]